jgi:CHAT domain-containing protein
VTGADLIHFAGHANFSHAHGMAASLATPGAPTTAADLLTLDLRRTKLCVLSGCETGRPADDAGDEFVGMLRALSFAGASCVISSTWLADDASTAHLMRDTYTRWLRGARLDSALSGAARDLLKTGGPDGVWRHPFFWANFSACGVV